MRDKILHQNFSEEQQENYGKAYKCGFRLVVRNHMPIESEKDQSTLQTQEK